MNFDLDGRTAFVTGAARGQGRRHAITLAQHGANIVAIDLCGQIDTVPYSMSTPEDLAETVQLVESTGRKIIAKQGDVRDFEQVQATVDEAFAAFGRIDIVVANAGTNGLGGAGGAGPFESQDIDLQRWRDCIDTNLTGVFNTIKAAVPAMISGERGGSIIATSSTAGIRGLRSMADYVAAKHGVVGLCRAFANELAEHSIRVNTVHPTGVATQMVENPELPAFFQAYPKAAVNLDGNLLPVDLVQPEDVSNAVLFLASDAARYVTGLEMTVDAGFTARA
ncbi:mycofactocin-coupled SDR family oxidoreductase [Mycolicibacterium baixiangningiae]|uniref:mycofactocin-coupled SDR family oxidoreductase n=1 Tax=Mycolicibacterium baixiangningiae TaxID=2761578 RepID=UPI0022B65102|nr:mycofactocin-coupled SDR family oxidoreductase [Mycolicibacterium baixiangningiae]